MSGSSDYTQTPNLQLFKPTYDADEDQWGLHLNANFDTLDATIAGTIVAGPNPPPLPRVGALWWNSNDGNTYIWYADPTSAQWVPAMFSGGVPLIPGGGPYLPLAGGNLTGAISLVADPTAAMQPVTLQYFNAHTVAGLPEAPTGGLSYARQGSTASWIAALPLAGGTLSGALTLAADPAAALQPVTLQYYNAHLPAAFPEAPVGGLAYARQGSTASWVAALPLTGVTNGTNAAAGQVGEYVTQTQSTNQPMTTTTPMNVTVIVLSAGDWDVDGSVYFGISVGATALAAAVSTISATLPPTPPAAGVSFVATTSATLANSALSTGTVRINVTVPTNAYLVAQANFGSGTSNAQGSIRARRVR